MENITNQQVGARIAAVRGEMKMTQAELALEMTARLGREIRPLTVTRLEGGKRPINVDELAAAAAALRINPADFFADDLPMGSVQIVSAFQTVVRASNQLITAVRQYDSAHQDFLEVLDRTDEKHLDRLPVGTRVFIEAARDWTIQGVIDEARNEGGASDGAEA
ncbi:helix-turn-helix transcriptional regulator [Mycobacterium marseillense]|uniref:helix-turn-helix domain-containing protein n=1 Tax=Mycobacterium marseillense TaxID=701042 RepID=UPI00259324D5|nr:helix-turn-helix transcriptional regulator [Mycobacterium marseillense]MDM3973279.1 helix-turn-helix transcriptional regulator [Mycobacterium marseillense]